MITAGIALICFGVGWLFGHYFGSKMRDEWWQDRLRRAARNLREDPFRGGPHYRM